MWPPESADKLEEFIEQSLAKESHHIDFKRDLTSDRRRVAEHLASFATDGGWLVVGVDEPEKGQFIRRPLSLPQDPERAEDIAQARIDPPLYIESTVLDRGDGTGYLLIRIPPSPNVVHAVDYIYLGRGDKEKRRLDDAEVDRRMRLRHSRFRDLTEYATQRMADYPEQSPETTRMLVRATPRTPQPKPLWDFTAPGKEEFIQAAIQQAEDAYRKTFKRESDAWIGSPWLTGQLEYHWPRPRGRAIGSTQIDPRRASAAIPDPTVPHVEARILESGAAEVWWAKPPTPPNTDPREPSFGQANDRDVVEASALGVALAASVAEEWRFDGVWDLVVRIEGPQGVGALTTHRRPEDPVTYPGREVYEETVTFTTRRAREQLPDITRLIVGSFLRSLNTYGRFFT